MTKDKTVASRELPKQQEVIGWYQPHISVQWTGMLIDNTTGELIPDPAAVSMTKQSFKDECDINLIVQRFEATGNIDHVNRAAASGLYTDLPDALDLQAALAMAQQAQDGFMALPADVRSQFGNDAVLFVDYVAHAANGDSQAQENLIKWGVATDNRPPAPPPPPPEAPQAPPALPPTK